MEIRKINIYLFLTLLMFPTLANSESVKISPQEKSPYFQYKACSMAAAKKYVRSGETAAAIAKAAINSCPSQRKALGSKPNQSLENSRAP